MPYLTFAICCLLWGSNFIMMERAGHALSPVAIGTLRLAGGAAVLGGVLAAQGGVARIPREQWKDIFFASLIGNAWPFVLMPLLVSRGYGHSFFGALVSLVPLMTIAFSVPMLRHWPTIRQIAGVIGGLAFVSLIVFDGNQRGMPTSLLALAITVPMAYAFSNTYLKWRLSDLPALPLTAAFLATGAVYLMPVWICSWLMGGASLGGPQHPHDWPVAIAALIYLSVAGTGLAAVLFIRLVQRHGPLFAAMVTYVVPCLALVWGSYDKERITALQCGAIAGVLLMVALVQFRGGQVRDGR